MRVKCQHISQRLQIGARGITNRGNLRDFKSGQTDYKSGQGFQIGAKRFQIETEISNWGKRDYKSGQGLQIGAEQALSFYQIYYVKNSSQQFVWRLTFEERSCTSEGNSWKTHVTTLMTPSMEHIYQEVSSSFQLI